MDGARMPLDVESLVDWLEELYPASDLSGSDPRSVDAALRLTGARDLIRTLRANLDSLQDDDHHV